MSSKHKEIESLLRDYYRAQRASNAAEAECTRAIEVILSQSQRANATVSQPSNMAFVAGQTRFIPKGIWISVVAITAITIILTAFELTGLAYRGWLSIAGALMALPCLFILVSSKSFKMMEMEQSCLFNAAAILFARMFLVGVSTLAAIALCCIACASDNSLIATFSCAMIPYFLASAGGLFLARRVSSADALPFAFMWVGAVCALTYATYILPPMVASGTSDTVLVAGALLSAAWFVRETISWSQAIKKSLCINESTMAFSRL